MILQSTDAANICRSRDGGHAVLAPDKRQWYDMVSHRGCVRIVASAGAETATQEGNIAQLDHICFGMHSATAELVIGCLAPRIAQEA